MAAPEEGPETVLTQRKSIWSGNGITRSLIRILVSWIFRRGWPTSPGKAKPITCSTTNQFNKV